MNERPTKLYNWQCRIDGDSLEERKVLAAMCEGTQVSDCRMCEEDEGEGWNLSANDVSSQPGTQGECQARLG